MGGNRIEYEDDKYLDLFRDKDVPQGIRIE
jgi:hypothetical protein